MKRQHSAASVPAALDEQFRFQPMNWEWKNNKHQKILGKELVIIQPTKPIEEEPNMIEFEIKTEDVVSFTSNTRFHIEGIFQYSTGADMDWTPCPVAQSTKVVVQPNWLEQLVKRVDVYIGGQLIVPADEGTHIAPFINTFLLAMMDKEQKRLLCPEPCSPCFAVPTKKGTAGWTETAGSEWQAYAQTIFTSTDIKFGHVFFQLFPFWQNSNYFMKMPKTVPISMTSPLTIRIQFNDNHYSIFKKVGTGVDNSYRFCFKKFELWTEQQRVSASTKMSLHREKKTLNYGGVCRLLRTENIPASLTVYRHTVQDVLFPEGILIYALPKDVIGGVYKYQNNTDGTVLSSHGISNVAIHFGDQNYFFNHPNIGEIKDSMRELNSLLDYLSKPPFGIKMDPDKVTLSYLADGFKNTPYPHVYLNLCNFADNSRIVPFLDKDASIVGKPGKLDIIMNFETGGAVNDVTYIAHLFYTDYILCYDLKSHRYQSPYIVKANQVI
jgi:hypothetical protein